MALTMTQDASGRLLKLVEVTKTVGAYIAVIQAQACDCAQPGICLPGAASCPIRQRGLDV